jgi:hypothetical protein
MTSNTQLLLIRALLKDDKRQISTVAELAEFLIVKNYSLLHIARLVHGFFAVPYIASNGGHYGKAFFKTEVT